MNAALLLMVTVPLAACANNRAAVASRNGTLPPAPGVEVGSREVIAVFPTVIGGQLTWPATRRASRWDADQWRLMIQLDFRWLVAVHQVDVDSSLVAPARSSTEAAVAAGHLLECDLKTHVLACGEPLRGSVSVVGGEVVMRILSSEWRHTLRSERPRSARLLFVRGGRDILWQGVIDIDYNDRARGA